MMALEKEIFKLFLTPIERDQMHRGYVPSFELEPVSCSTSIRQERKISKEWHYLKKESESDRYIFSIAPLVDKAIILILMPLVWWFRY